MINRFFIKSTVHCLYGGFFLEPMRKRESIWTEGILQPLRRWRTTFCTWTSYPGQNYRSEALKNGKKAVKITRTNENGELMDFDGVVFFRSPKRYSSYGKTPFFFVAHLGAEMYSVKKLFFCTKKYCTGCGYMVY